MRRWVNGVATWRERYQLSRAIHNVDSVPSLNGRVGNGHRYRRCSSRYRALSSLPRQGEACYEAVIRWRRVRRGVDAGQRDGGAGRQSPRWYLNLRRRLGIRGRGARKRRRACRRSRDRIKCRQSARIGSRRGWGSSDRGSSAGSRSYPAVTGATTSEIETSERTTRKGGYQSPSCNGTAGNRQYGILPDPTSSAPYGTSQPN